MLKRAWASLFAPTRVATDPELAQDQRMVATYAHGVRLVVSCCTGLLYVHRPILGIALVLAVFGCSWACEWIIAWLLQGHVPSRQSAIEDHAAFWRSLCAWFSTHLIVSGGGGTLLMVGVRAAPVVGKVYLFLSLAVLVVMSFLWWWGTLGRAVIAGGVPCLARTVIVYLIPMVGIGCGLLGANLVLILYFLVPR